eukprot:3939686-Rhodomonas_salina.1
MRHYTPEPCAFATTTGIANNNTDADVQMACKKCPDLGEALYENIGISDRKKCQRACIPGVSYQVPSVVTSAESAIVQDLVCAECMPYTDCTRSEQFIPCTPERNSQCLPCQESDSFLALYNQEYFIPTGRTPNCFVRCISGFAQPDTDTLR